MSEATAWSAVRTAMAEERPLLKGPLPLLAVLALGAVGVLDGHLSIRLALWLGVAQLPRRQRGVRPAHRAPRGGRALKAAAAAVRAARVEVVRTDSGRDLPRQPGGGAAPPAHRGIVPPPGPWSGPAGRSSPSGG